MAKNEQRPVPQPIAVVGLGNMGVSVLAAFLSRGLSVVAVDRDREKLDALAAGHSPVPERSVEEILARGFAEGRLTTATDCAQAGAWEATFVAVQTPAGDTECDYSALRAVLRELATHVAGGHLLMVGSTVLPGAIAGEIQPILKECDADLVYHPVFLRAGVGVEDYLRPGKTVLGVDDPANPPARLVALMDTILQDTAPRYVTYAESEWIKVVHNAFMSVKIAFVNEVALLCEGHSVDPTQVIDITLDETPFGRLLTRSHTQPGIPFSGPCLPKDAQLFAGLGQRSLYPELMDQGLTGALQRSNEGFRKILVDRWLALAGKSRGPLGVVGMSFRPGFNEMRFSLALDFVRAARARGLEVRAYDPAFEGISESDYRLACRQDAELLELYEIACCSLEDVWSTRGVFLNRTLDSSEHARIAHLPAPPVVDIYQNRLKSRRAVRMK